jgi:hypothetical protein
MRRRTRLLTSLTIPAPISLVARGEASERLSEEAAERAVGWTVVAGFEGAVTAACDSLAASMSGWTPTGDMITSGDSFCALGDENGQDIWQASVAADSGTVSTGITN